SQAGARAGVRSRGADRPRAHARRLSAVRRSPHAAARPRLRARRGNDLDAEPRRRGDGMNHLQREAGSPMEIVPEPSGMLDLTHLVQEDDRPPPPGLTEEESPWWPSATHVHSSVLSISGPMSSATAWQ